MLSIPWATSVAFAGLAFVPALALPPAAVSLARLAGSSLLPAFSGACERTVGWKASTDSAATFGVRTAGGTHAR
jgi:hypothetical protein